MTVAGERQKTHLGCSFCLGGVGGSSNWLRFEGMAQIKTKTTLVVLVSLISAVGQRQ